MKFSFVDSKNFFFYYYYFSRSVKLFFSGIDFCHDRLVRKILEIKKKIYFHLSK